MTHEVRRGLTDRLIEGYIRFLWRRRALVLVLLGAVTVFWALQTRKVEMYSQFSDLLPQGHPYIQAYNHHKETFGAANVLTMMVYVHEGDIFNTATLEKVKYLTEQVELIDGVDHEQVSSIYHVKLRNVRVLPGGNIHSSPVLPAVIPTDPQQLLALKFEMFNNDMVYNQYVSADGKAALLLAGFNEARLDYRTIHTEIMRLKQAVEDDNTILYVAGEPMLKGWVWRFSHELFSIFCVTAAIVVALLRGYFRRLYGVLIPLVGALIQAVWGLGWIGWWRVNLDPLILVIPVLITARAVSHGVQMIERYFEALEETRDQERAAFVCLHDLFLPGVTGVISDAGGILALGVTTIPLIQKLAYFTGSFWAFANLFCITHMMPLLLSYLPPPRRTDHRVPQWMLTALGRLAQWTTRPWTQWGILAASAAIVVLGVRTVLTIPIGEQESGSPLFWREAYYNVSARAINERFAGANQFVLYVEGKEPHMLKEPRVLAVVEDLCRYLLAQPEAGGTRDMATLVRNLNRLWHYGDPRWQVQPVDRITVGNYILVYEVGAANSLAILEHMDRLYQNGRIVIFYKDTKGDTIREAVARAKKFIAEHPVEGVQFRLAGGLVGVQAALNEEIAVSEKRATLLVILTVYMLVLVSYGSFAAANMVLAALVAAGVVSYLYIALMGIGLTIHSLPVSAVGMGIGVDYILYVVDRIRREIPLAGGDIHAGIHRAISTTGMAVTLTAAAMMVGILPWYLLSSLRFSAEMALLLSILLLTHWLSALVLTPALFAVFRPKFARGSAPRNSPPPH